MALFMNMANKSQKAVFQTKVRLLGIKIGKFPNVFCGIMKLHRVFRVRVPYGFKMVVEKFIHQ
jgi:hypothetical protein